MDAELGGKTWKILNLATTDTILMTLTMFMYLYKISHLAGKKFGRNSKSVTWCEQKLFRMSQKISFSN